MEPASPAPVKRPLPHWLLEGLFIVISVALGFGVAQYGEYRNDRELASRALTGITREIEQNVASLEPYLPFHTTWLNALAQADTSNASQSGLDIWFRLRPTLPEHTNTPFPFLKRSAWDAALSSGAFRLIDYELAAPLSDIYRLQEILSGNVERLATGAFSATATFDPSARAASVRLLWLSLADIQAAEVSLVDLYKQHLPLMRPAAAR